MLREPRVFLEDMVNRIVTLNELLKLDRVKDNYACEN